MNAGAHNHQPAGIEAISYYLPPEQLTNEKLSSEFPEWSVDKIAAKTGIHTRHIAAPDVCASDLAYESAIKLFAEHNLNPQEIDFLLLCTQSPDYFLPTTACLLQERLGLPTTIGALDFNLGCSGYVYGLSLARSLIASGDAKNVLLITAETYSKFIHPKDKSVRTLFGDAAAATLIKAGGKGKIGTMIFGTDGRGGENLIVKKGGSRLSTIDAPSHEIEDEYGNIHNDQCLYMNGAEIFNFTLATVPASVNKLLLQTGWALDEVDLFVFHQANRYMMEALRKLLKIPAEKFQIFMEDCGNTVSSTIPIALYHAHLAQKIKPGSKVMLLGFGVGYSWAGCALAFH